MTCLIFRGLLNLMRANNHLVEIDPLTARSWMCLLPMEKLVECSVITNIQLLDILLVVHRKTSSDISHSNHKVKFGRGRDLSIGAKKKSAKAY